MRSMLLLSSGLLFCAAALGSCAKGTTLDLQEGDGGAGGGAAAGGGGETGTGGAGTGEAGGGGSGGDTTSTGGGGEGGMGAGGGGGMGGNPCDFQASNTCATAEQLPAVSGDEGGTSNASGAGSRWFKVQVKETDSSIFSSDLSYKVTLTSPAGMDYDLYILQGPEDGSPNCGAAPKKGTLSGGSESVSASWNDDQGLGGEDDSLWLSIEVRHVSGDLCDAKWNLAVVGDP